MEAKISFAQLVKDMVTSDLKKAKKKRLYLDQKLNENAVQKTSCRVCKSNKLTTILDLGEIYISNFIDTRDDIQKQIKAPLELVLVKVNVA